MRKSILPTSFFHPYDTDLFRSHTSDRTRWSGTDQYEDRHQSSSGNSPPLFLSHAWIVVTTGAPQRTVLEKAGFRIAPNVNRHDGQGTASVTVEFFNGFLELMYPDPTVPVTPALKIGAEKFRLKSE